MNKDLGKAELNPLHFLIALLPAAVFLLSVHVVRVYGTPPDPLPDRIIEFNAYKEAAARIGMLAGLMLFAGAVLAAILLFAASLRPFDAKRRVTMAAACLALAGAAMLTGDRVKGMTAQDFGGRSLMCLASGFDKAHSDAARTEEQKPTKAEAAAKGPQSAAAKIEAGVSTTHLRLFDKKTGSCIYPRFGQLRILEEWQFVATTLAFSALVFASICCLAGRTDSSAETPLPTAQDTRAPAPAPGGAPARADGQPATAAADPELQHWERQSEWLNTCLYLSALLLATGLLFINAFLRFPGFLLLDHGDHEAYVATLISYYGFVFTVMLASFYIPVAAILTGKVRERSRQEVGKGKLPDAFQGPLQILKIVVGLLSTSLAGILPAVLDHIA